MRATSVSETPVNNEMKSAMKSKRTAKLNIKDSEPIGSCNFSFSVTREG